MMSATGPYLLLLLIILCFHIKGVVAVEIKIKPGTAATQGNLLTGAEKLHNTKWSEYYGIILNAYWGFLVLLAFGRLITLRLYPRKGSGPLPLVSKFRKYAILPATWGGKHVEPQRISNIPVNVIPTRWQSIVVFVFIVLNIILMFVDMWTVPNNTIYFTQAIMAARNIGDRSGVLGMALFPILFLSGGRNNLLMFFTGWSFETFNVFHRWIGRVMFVQFAVHSWAYTYYYSHLGEYRGFSNAAYWEQAILDNKDNFIGIIAIVIMGIILIQAGPYSKAKVTLHGDAVYVAVKPAVNFHAQPGQYAFLYVLRHNFWESHPFSIMDTRDKQYVFVTRIHNGMTKKLHQSLTGQNTNDTVNVWIEGPYGHSHPIARYGTVLLVAGGIGVTGIMAYALDLNRRKTQQHVRLYWMVREKSSLRWVQDQLQEITEGGRIDIHIYVTGKTEEVIKEIHSEPESTSLSDQPEKGQAISHVDYAQRPDMSSVIGDTVRNAEGSVAVVACGPGPLADACRKAVADNVDKAKWRVDYFEDAYSWA
ncbi:ferric reductase NAD binding domain-containing protein [Lipomyces mesembrius]